MAEMGFANAYADAGYFCRMCERFEVLIDHTIVPLKKKEETILFQELREAIGTNRGEMIERRLIESQLPLVASIAQKHTASGIPMRELIEEGNLGLIKSVKLFAESPHGEDFPVFAATYTEDAITKAYRKGE